MDENETRAMMERHTVLETVRKMIGGYNAGIHGDLRAGTAMLVDIEFRSMADATSCAATLTKEDEWEHIAPRTAVHADVIGPETVHSIHDPITLRFELNGAWVRKVIEQNHSE